MKAVSILKLPFFGPVKSMIQHFKSVLENFKPVYLFSNRFIKISSRFENLSTRIFKAQTSFKQLDRFHTLHQILIKNQQHCNDLLKHQVTEETANVLTSFGIKCTFRGEINVKGKGLVPTFFVSISENLEFEKEILQTSSDTFEAQL